MKTIGILGGMGPQATIDLEQKIHLAAQMLIKPDVARGYPPMITAYHRGAPMLLDSDGEVVDPLKPDPKMLDLARQLGPLVDFVVVPCNAAHLFMQEITDAAERDLLSIVGVTIEEVKRRGLSKVGLLAVGESLRHRLYQDRLDEIGVDYKIPPDELIAPLDEAIWGVMEGNSPQTLKDLLHGVFDYLFREGEPEGIILGCTELPLYKYSHVVAPRIINPSELLAQAAVKYALES